jgi:RimJ/RimL family protein N-acetyltransferase
MILSVFCHIQKKITTMLRKATSSDYDFIYGLYFHPLVNPYLLYEMEEAEQFATIFEALMQANLLYLFEKEGVTIGMFKLIPLAHRTSHIAYLGGLAIAPEQSGKGLGQVMLLEILALCKEKGILRLELSTATHNEKAIRLYEKVGFEREGILRRYTNLKSEGRMIDELLMSYLF